MTRLLLNQKNRLFDLIIERGLSPSVFSFVDYGILRTPRIQYVIYSDFYFEISGQLIYFSPATKKFSDTEFWYDWKDVERIYIKWLDLVQYELTGVDKWKQMEEKVTKTRMQDNTSRSKNASSKSVVVK